MLSRLMMMTATALSIRGVSSHLQRKALAVVVVVDFEDVRHDGVGATTANEAKILAKTRPPRHGEAESRRTRRAGSGGGGGAGRGPKPGPGEPRAPGKSRSERCLGYRLGAGKGSGAGGAIAVGAG